VGLGPACRYGVDAAAPKTTAMTFLTPAPSDCRAGAGRFPRLTLAAIAAGAVLGFAASFVNAGPATADGAGSQGSCNANPKYAAPLAPAEVIDGSIEGSADLVEFDAGASGRVAYVCIKAGGKTFEGVKHSGPLGNGTFDHNGLPVSNVDPLGCYEVDGVGSRAATVRRLQSNTDCQGISHIDVGLLYEAATPTTTVCPTPTPAFTATATWTETSTATPSSTGTSTATATAPATEAATATAAYTATATATATAAYTATATATATTASTATATATASVSATSTTTGTATAAWTATATPPATLTMTATATAELGYSPTPSPTAVTPATAIASSTTAATATDAGIAPSTPCPYATPATPLAPDAGTGGRAGTNVPLLFVGLLTTLLALGAGGLLLAVRPRRG